MVSFIDRTQTLYKLIQEEYQKKQGSTHFDIEKWKKNKNDKNDRIFLNSALELKDEIRALENDVSEYAAQYMRFNEVEQNSETILSIFTQIASNIADLMDYLQDQEKEMSREGKSDTINVHSLSHFKGILDILSEQLQNLKLKFQKIKLMQLDKAQSQKNIVYGKKTELSVSPELQKEFERQQQDDDTLLNSLTEAQQQELEQENYDIHSELNALFNDVELAEHRATDVRTLASILSLKISEQAETIDQLFIEAEGSSANIEAANQQLTKSKERPSTMRLMMAGILFFFALYLLLLHIINP